MLGAHKVICGSALDQVSYERLLGDHRAQMTFSDPPYNVPIAGHVESRGHRQHREFVEASGEMTSPEFTSFLSKSAALVAAHSIDGAIIYICMDWRHQLELLVATASIFGTPKNICVWVKNNGGQGSFYRSQHEFVDVFKNGNAPHINNFRLGENGRYRTNCWFYRGVNTFGRNRDAELAMHPTVKPVALVADAIRDCSKRGGLVLDPFGGSGTTMIAAERTGRAARLIELDPLYCDVIVRRWQDFAHTPARRAQDGRSFEEIAHERGANVVTPGECGAEKDPEPIREPHADACSAATPAPSPPRAETQVGRVSR